MKSEKGITLISLIIYVIVMLVVVMIISVLTSYFYTNVNNQYLESKNENNEVNLDMYLIKDLKNKKVSIKNADLEDMQAGIESDHLLLMYDSGSSVFYSITDDGIYREKVKLYNKEASDNMSFVLAYVIQNGSSVSSEKIEVRILKNGEIIKSYIVNTKLEVIDSATSESF